MKTMRHAFQGRNSRVDVMLELVESNKKGEPVGIYSVCSANRFVLEAAMLQARRDDTAVCIESTSNQVNQFGGYAGMTPEEFAKFVQGVAAAAAFPLERIILGGDHLGPHVWRNEPARVAMAKAKELVRRCVLAGYTKIHLDASMRCADDPGEKCIPLGDEVVTERTADLCQVAEAAHSELPAGAPAPLYVIGTEVPIPGGERATDEGPSVTHVADVARTIGLAHDVFLSRGLESAWQRAIAVVVQAGVEYGDTSIFVYDREKARDLSAYIDGNWHIVYEAHSTDYQPADALKKMVEDHFAILKVGPWLTFAFREAIFALAEMEEEWLAGKKSPSLSRVREVLDEAMLRNPDHWKKYYQGDEAHIRFARKYSYSDRCRYYWPRADVRKAVTTLFQNLSRWPVPLNLLSQYMPVQYNAVREGRIANTPTDLVHSKILEVIDLYATACGVGPELPLANQ